METIKDLSSLSDDNFIQLLRIILDEYFHRLPSIKQAVNIDLNIRQYAEQLLRNTNPTSNKILINDLPENLQKVYMKFIHDYRDDIERYHVQRAGQFMDEYRLKNVDWSVRIVLHDEHLFKCRLPLTSLQLELTNEKDSKDVLLELDEQELDRLINEMLKIDQTINNSNLLLTQ